MDIPRSLSILREACELNGVAFEIVDEFTGYVARISKRKGSHLVGLAGASPIGLYPLNRAAPFGIARDKAFTHDVLKKAGFRVPDGAHFFLKNREGFERPPGKNRADAVRFAQRLSDGYARPVVVKPNGGKGAKLVTFVRSAAALADAFSAIQTVDDIALVQSFIDEPEFRLFLVDGHIAFAYEKSRPVITGDGTSTIAELAANSREGADLVESDYLKAHLEASGVSTATVLPKGERLVTGFIANISAGGTFGGFIRPTPVLEEWALRVAKAVSLRVTGVDVFSHSHLANPNDCIITDVNGSPNLGTLYDLGHKALVLEVWKDILAKTFEQDWPEGF